MPNQAAVIDDEPLTFEELQDKYLRALAELENLRTRKTREVDAARDAGEAHATRAFLPIIDDLERALSALLNLEAAPAATVEAWSMIRDKFVHTLKSLDTEGFRVQGEKFAAELMEAVAQTQSKLPPGTVVEQVSQGFLRRGRLLQPAQVIVAIPEEP
jgi:molecular chaperone GrpE